MVTIPVWKALQWWIDPLNLQSGLPLSPPTHSHVLTTDASESGWGAVLDDSHPVQGIWTQDQQNWHINALELKAVELALWEFRQTLQGQVVLVRSDNATACAYIN